MAQKKKTVTTDVTPDTKFYIIPFENDDLILRKEVLYKHYNNPIAEKRYTDRARVDKVSYDKEIFTLDVQLPKEKSHKVFVHIERHELYVTCECGMLKGGLCHHSYYGLFYLMHYKDKSLKEFYWPELQEKINDNYKYIYIDAEGHHLYIYPKQEFGNIFKVGLGFSDDEHISFKIKSVENINFSNTEIIGYAIIFTDFGMRYSHLPFLMPFIGITSKNGDGIVSYKRFLRKDKAYPHKVVLNHNQIILNEISYDMFLLSKSVGRFTSALNNENWNNAVPALIESWRRVIPKLLEEKFFVGCRSFGFKSWNDKPKKSYIRDQKLECDKLRISFILKRRKEHFELRPVITIPGKEICHYQKIPLFLIDREDDTFYLVNSAQDEFLLNWLTLYGYKLTILKQHFLDFQIRFLKNLSECYPVYYQAFGSKSKVHYDFETYKI